MSLRQEYTTVSVEHGSAPASEAPLQETPPHSERLQKADAGLASDDGAAAARSQRQFRRVEPLPAAWYDDPTAVVFAFVVVLVVLWTARGRFAGGGNNVDNVLEVRLARKRLVQRAKKAAAEAEKMRQMAAKLHGDVDPANIRHVEERLHDAARRTCDSRFYTSLADKLEVYLAGCDHKQGWGALMPRLAAACAAGDLNRTADVLAAAEVPGDLREATPERENACFIQAMSQWLDDEAFESRMAELSGMLPGGGSSQQRQAGEVTEEAIQHALHSLRLRQRSQSR
eukprot:Rhum_TRINITY_DN23416_c0_g1::Rhum_TRINITY_DN23416_c0_g1_i1::g.177963::m.177963